MAGSTDAEHSRDNAFSDDLTRLLVPGKKYACESFIIIPEPVLSGMPYREWFEERIWLPYFRRLQLLGLENAEEIIVQESDVDKGWNTTVRGYNFSFPRRHIRYLNITVYKRDGRNPGAAFIEEQKTKVDDKFRWCADHLARVIENEIKKRALKCECRRSSAPIYA
jgi:hypothetical protein